MNQRVTADGGHLDLVVHPVDAQDDNGIRSTIGGTVTVIQTKQSNIGYVYLRQLLIDTQVAFVQLTAVLDAGI